jgi:hypothetical protein
MTASGWVAVALAVVGFALELGAIAAMLRVKINTAQASDQLCKLGRARNVERARKLCDALPGSWMRAVAAGIDAVEPNTTDPRVAEGPMRAAFDKAGAALASAWARATLRGLLGALVVGGSVALAQATPTMRPTFDIAGAAGACAALFLLAQRGYVTTSLARVRAEVLPALAEGFSTTRE